MAVKDILEREDGSTIDDVLLVNFAELKQTRNDRTFWSVVLKDRSGQITSKIWSPIADEISSIPKNAFVHILAKKETYMDSPQLVIEKLEFLNDDDINKLDMSRYTKTGICKSVHAMMNELEGIFEKELKYPELLNFVKSIFSDHDIREQFMKSPGAVSFHHAYVGGLLEHTLAVCRNVLAISKEYKGIDRQVLLVGAALHDIGKIKEYAISNMLPERTLAGNAIGHISLGVEMLAPFFAKSSLPAGVILHLQHLILSHHGTFEYGSPVLPMTPEAVILNISDELDAKMNQFFNALDDSIAVGKMIPWIKTLGRAVFKAEHVPDAMHDDSDIPMPDDDFSARVADEMDAFDAVVPDDSDIPMPDDDFSASVADEMDDFNVVEHDAFDAVEHDDSDIPEHDDFSASDSDEMDDFNVAEHDDFADTDITDSTKSETGSEESRYFTDFDDEENPHIPPVPDISNNSDLPENPEELKQSGDEYSSELPTDDARKIEDEHDIDETLLIDFPPSDDDVESEDDHLKDQPVIKEEDTSDVAEEQIVPNTNSSEPLQAESEENVPKSADEVTEKSQTPPDISEIEAWLNEESPKSESDKSEPIHSIMDKEASNGAKETESEEEMLEKYEVVFTPPVEYTPPHRRKRKKPQCSLL